LIASGHDAKIIGEELFVAIDVPGLHGFGQPQQ
jgi:hypothetical protein